MIKKTLGLVLSLALAASSFGITVAASEIAADDEGMYIVDTTEEVVDSEMGAVFGEGDSAGYYTVQFDGNMANSGAMSPVDFKCGKKTNLPSNMFVRTGWTFKGWNTERDGSGEKTYKNKAAVKNLTKESGGLVILYAQWKKNTYTIAFSGNGKDSGKMAKKTKLEYGESYELPENVFARKGYTFTGWSKKKDGSGDAFPDKATVTEFPEKSGKTVTLYAQWKKETYKINYELNGGVQNASNPDTYTVTDTVKLKKPTKEGCTFKGWYTTADFSKKKVTSIKKGSTDEKTFYAKWSESGDSDESGEPEKVSFYVRFDAGGARGIVPDMMQCNPGAANKAPWPNLAKEGYNFKGWCANSSGSGTCYAPEESLSKVGKRDGETVILYAIWEKMSDKETKCASEMVSLVNARRTGKGVGAVKVNSMLSAAAQVRAQEIKKIPSNVRPDTSGVNYIQFYKITGYNAKSGTEIVAAAWGSDAKEVLDEWINAGASSKILDSKFKDIGVGCYCSNGSYYWVVCLATDEGFEW